MSTSAGVPSEGKACLISNSLGMRPRFCGQKDVEILKFCGEIMFAYGESLKKRSWTRKKLTFGGGDSGGNK